MSVPLAGPGAQDVALTCPGTGEHTQEAVTEDVVSRRPLCTIPIARRLVPWASPGSSRSLGASPSGCTQCASGDRRTRRDNPGHLPGPSWDKPRRPAADRPDAALGRAFAVTLGLHSDPWLPRARRQRLVASGTAGVPGSPPSALPGSGPRSQDFSCKRVWESLPQALRGSGRTLIKEPCILQRKELRF